MAVRIRLRRIGTKKKPFYRVVVADSRSPRDGRFLDTIGWYDPVSNPVKLKIDADKAMRWLSDGAEPTDSARSVLSQAGIWQRFRVGETWAAQAGVAAAEAGVPAAEAGVVATEADEPGGVEAPGSAATETDALGGEPPEA